ncbi:MAG TPA: ATP-grasp domain-containing protein [Gaiellaceae bacterium]|nr:ATP-grasp domain-containing protein [Gaiellaceae bacterium]
MTIDRSFTARRAAADPAVLRAPGAEGDALRRALIARSTIAVIEPGYPTKRFLYERAAELDAVLVLVGGHESEWARTLVDEGIASRFLDADLSGDPDSGADAVLAALGLDGRAIDGVVTFWEDAVPATARVAAALGLAGATPAAADGARSKLRTLEASRAAGLPTPRFMRLESSERLQEAASYIGFPAVIKPVFGAEALGVLRVDDFESLEAGYSRVAELVTPELNAIFLQGCDLLLEEYLDGIEFDVDMVFSGGACVFSAISENWPTHEPYFVETGMHSPSAHPPERLAAMTDLCVRTALALGFRDSILHAEAKDTSRGPRLLELNARLGGGSIPDTHRHVTGVDLVEQQLLVALGLPAAPTGEPVPVVGVVTVYVHASRSGILEHDGFLDHLAADPTVIVPVVPVAPGERVTAAEDGFPTVIAEFTVVGANVDDARERARAIAEELDVPYAG